MPETDDERLLTRRELDERAEAHRREHDQIAIAVEKALDAVQKQQHQHNDAHDKAHESHEAKHDSENESIQTALVAVARERIIHSEAHDREHLGHQREHSLNNLAIDKAEAATDKRFGSTNAYREQINDMIRNLAPREAVDVLVKEVDRRFEEARLDRERRYEELRQSLATLERTDVKAEGRGIGQTSVVAYVVTATGLIATVLAIIVIVANVLTSAPI